MLSKVLHMHSWSGLKMIKIMLFVFIGTKSVGKITYNKDDVIGKGGQGTCIYKWVQLLLK